MAATATRTKTQRRRVGRGERDPDLSRYAGRIAARIRKLRKEREWSVKELAERITAAGFDCSEPALRGWESGLRDVNHDAIPAIASAFGMTVRRFVPAE